MRVRPGLDFDGTVDDRAVGEGDAHLDHRRRDIRRARSASVGRELDLVVGDEQEAAADGEWKEPIGVVQQLARVLLAAVMAGNRLEKDDAGELVAVGEGDLQLVLDLFDAKFAHGCKWSSQSSILLRSSCRVT